MNRALIGLTLLFSSSIAFAKPMHPLDPLEAGEYAAVVSTLKDAGKLGPATLFPTITLNEPPKAEVLAWKEGAPFRREAFAVVFDREKNKTYEAVVDLKTKKVAEWKEKPGVHPPVMLSEFETLPPIVKADARWQEAMKKRGITNFDEVIVDIWAYGTPDSEKAETTRMMRAITYYKGKGKNFYARPIDGLTVLVNVNEKKVEQVTDTETLPVPPDAFEYDSKSLKPRVALKPLKISQPSGANFVVRGNQIEFHPWRFRFTMHPREGLVIHQVEYSDKGKWRPVLYRASLSEMMVLYGHSNQHWFYRNAFDEGEYGIGRYSGSLDIGNDVPAYAKTFDAAFSDDFGKPIVVKDAVAVYERDGGLLWKHRDMYGGSNESRRGRDLVIGFITTISNYDYGLNWVFHEDGSMELEAQLTGIMLAKSSKMTKMDHSSDDPDAKFAHLVAPNVVAPHHQHFLNFRLDLDVDGTANSVAELDARPLPEGDENPYLNAFVMEENPIKSEKNGIRDLSYATQRKWKIFNPATSNRLGYHSSFILIPGENAAPFLHKDSPLRKRGGFVNHPVWFTQFRDEERFAAGPYPLQRKTSDGLPVWTAEDRSLDKQDVVLWYTFCVTHAPRPEEWPVMTTHKTGFKLIPAGFFDHNPAIDVPKTKK
jgi:primary-amine oxidase